MRARTPRWTPSTRTRSWPARGQPPLGWTRARRRSACSSRMVGTAPGSVCACRCRIPTFPSAASSSADARWTCRAAIRCSSCQELPEEVRPVCSPRLASRSGDHAAARRPGRPPGAATGRAHGQRRPRRGQIMVLFALMVPAIIAMIGLAVDGGRLLAERRRLQGAADAAAWAAASELLYGTPANAEAVARWYLVQNGYTSGGDTTVTVAQPPSTGPNAGRSDAVQVTVQRAVTLTLAQIVHPEPITVGAGATGGPSPGAAP